ncbi:MAG: hypothetical protein ACFFCI_20135 [Promethearchaeota archaeon]
MDIVLECVIHSIISSLLNDYYKARYTPKSIQSLYGFFASEVEVVDWTRRLFGIDPDDLVILLASGGFHNIRTSS